MACRLINVCALQVGNHDSIEDARTAMALFRKYQEVWEFLMNTHLYGCAIHRVGCGVLRGVQIAKEGSVQRTIEKLYADAHMYTFRVPEDGKRLHTPF